MTKLHKLIVIYFFFTLGNVQTTDFKNDTNGEHEFSKKNISENWEIPVKNSVGKSVSVSNVTSCVGKCGQLQQMPCACDVRCSVHKNCCEDMVEACPDVLEESQTLYTALHGSVVLCSSDGIFQISTCPPRQNRMDLSRPRTKRPKTLFTSNSLEVVNSEKVRLDLFKILIEGPVTDVKSGFVFKNIDVFKCYALKDAEPILWNANFEESFITNENTNNETKSPIYLKPRLTEQIKRASQCHPSSIGVCKKKEHHSNSSLMEKCQAQISYVKVGKKNIYSNKYCAYCSEDVDAQGMVPVTEPFSSERGLEFSIISSITNNKLRLMAVNVGRTSWKSATCNTTKQDIIDGINDDIVCSEDGCNHDFTMRPSGHCKREYVLQVAISDEGIPISEEELKSISRYFKCAMKQTEFDIGEEWKPPAVDYDQRLSVYLYRFTYIWYSNYNMIAIYPDISILANHIRKLIALSKGVTFARRARFLTNNKPTKNVPQHNISQIRSIDLHMVIPQIEEHLTLYPEVNASTVPVCLCCEKLSDIVQYLTSADPACRLTCIVVAGTEETYPSVYQGTCLKLLVSQSSSNYGVVWFWLFGYVFVGSLFIV